MGSGLGVLTAELDGLANAMSENPWFAPSIQVAAADDLPVAQAAAANLNANARVLEQYRRWAEAENRRTAEMLRIAARAYDDIDTRYADRFDDPARTAALEAVSVPVPSTPMPPLPDAPAAMQPLSAGDYSDVDTTQRLLSGGDHGASLDVAQVHWGLAARSAQGHAAPAKVTNWEGDAADAARERMTTFSAWLQELSVAWQRLSAAAGRVRASHAAALAEHTNIHTRYKFLEARMQELAAQMSTANAAATRTEMARIGREMADLQRRSDEVREEYADNATFDPVQVGQPPFSAPSGTAHPSGASGGNGAGGARGGPLSGDPAAMADRMAQSLGQPAASGPPAGTGAPAGGGAPTGAGGGGGATPAGSPTGTPPTTAPRTPTDPRLRPAAASGGGGSSGGAGGGAGGSAGGLPPAPMSAAVKAETVAPAPTVPAAAGAAPGFPGGAAMGGMGAGMAPMAHGAGARQGKEKRRDPRLAPDEDLYTEDRPWTEAVVGQQRRRRDAHEKIAEGGSEGGDSQ
ncbi:PPE domain-containing protein [Mycobacterium sp. IDR2000157661]|uniref:PPE domain-containing protein n=1 Tax=Mycobacterium sp. IDR2000157661 TaxID=2867005 RepID=UPI001EEEF3BE|nr:hypothetical protein [Mycobacterium sp. IDR2000157661]ULE34840.1 hypothetical protein K3G64_09770 [Mycobacterium sp. IDR2000157661]